VTYKQARKTIVTLTALSCILAVLLSISGSMNMMAYVYKDGTGMDRARVVDEMCYMMYLRGAVDVLNGVTIDSVYTLEEIDTRYHNYSEDINHFKKLIGICDAH